jgi:hypothetical protein
MFFQQTSEKELLGGENFLHRTCNYQVDFSDPLLYFDPKQLFHYAYDIKITCINYQGNLDIQVL